MASREELEARLAAKQRRLDELTAEGARNDEKMRRSFLENVPTHREILKEFCEF